MVTTCFFLQQWHHAASLLGAGTSTTDSQTQPWFSVRMPRSKCSLDRWSAPETSYPNTFYFSVAIGWPAIQTSGPSWAGLQTRHVGNAAHYKADNMKILISISISILPFPVLVCPTECDTRNSPGNGSEHLDLPTRSDVNCCFLGAVTTLYLSACRDQCSQCCSFKNLMWS